MRLYRCIFNTNSHRYPQGGNGSLPLWTVEGRYCGSEAFTEEHSSTHRLTAGALRRGMVGVGVNGDGDWSVLVLFFLLLVMLDDEVG